MNSCNKKKDIITLINVREVRKLKTERIICPLACFMISRYYRLFSSKLRLPSISCYNRSNRLFSSTPSGSSFDFNAISEKSLNSLLEKLEEKELQLPSTFDADFSQGVLTIKFTSQIIYVLNKQPPNQQIWLSSPFSGPKRFEWRSSDKSWRDVRDEKVELVEFLEAEFRDKLKLEIQMNSNQMNK